MPFSRDFLNVRIRDDRTTLIVDAKTTDDDTGELAVDDPADEIYITLIKVSDARQRLVKPVGLPVDSTWSCEFPGAASTWTVDEEVHAIGFAREGDGLPEMWQGTLTISEGGGDEPSEGPVEGEAAPPPDL